jgi:hypothetical protein
MATRHANVDAKFSERGMTEWFMPLAQPVANSYSLSVVYRFSSRRGLREAV